MNRLTHNPFATRYTRPGALPYYFSDGTTLDRLIDRLSRHRWQGQIVGPHGSGKSTLLTHLQRELSGAGRKVLAAHCRTTARQLPAWPSTAEWNPSTQIVVDGYEQLSWPSRIWLRWWVARRGAGLVITTHRRVWGLPVLWRTASDLATAQHLVRELVSPHHLDAQRLHERLPQLWGSCQGNMRELLFALYDELQESAVPASIVTEVSDASSACPPGLEKT